MPYLDVSSRLGSVAIFGIAYATGHIGLTIAATSFGLTHDQMGLMGDVNDLIHHAITFLFDLIHHAITFLFNLLHPLFEALNRGVTIFFGFVSLFFECCESVLDRAARAPKRNTLTRSATDAMEAATPVSVSPPPPYNVSPLYISDSNYLPSSKHMMLTLDDSVNMKHVEDIYNTMDYFV